MRVNRSLILFVLACLTICFIGTAYALWFNPTGLPIVGANNDEVPDVAAAIGIGDQNSAVHLTVDRTGIAGVTAAQLRTAGLDFQSLSDDELALTYDGQSVPYWVRHDESDDTLYFYAEAEPDPLAPLAVYELRTGQGVEMQERSAQPFNEGIAAAKHFLDWQERGLFVEKGAADQAWMGPLLLAPAQWILHLDGIEPDGGPATLHVDLFAAMNTGPNEQHHAQFKMNDRIIAEHLWEGDGTKRVRIPLAAGILSEDDANQLTIEILDDAAPAGDAIYVDGVQLTYEGPIDVAERGVTFTAESPNLRIDGVQEGLMVFDVTDAAMPVALTDIRIDGDTAQLAAGTKEAELIALNPDGAIKPLVEVVPDWERSLLADDWGADYVAIVANVRGFSEAIAPLLAYREEEGMRVATVSLEQVFDEFSHGHRDPQAIKDFIAHAVETWAPPAPQFVLLVGDATYDVTNRMSGKNRNRLPTPIVYAGEGGYVASDAWYVADEEGMPIAAIGRFPAQNAPQLTNMVSKSIAYETALAEGDRSWREEALVVADDEPQFDDTMNDVTEFLEEGGFEVYDLHVSDDDRVRHSILSAINQGVGLISYIGQGSAVNWGDEAVLQSSDAQTLYNGSHLAIYNTFTCSSGSFAEPRNDSLSESLLEANSGGIVAAVVPSGAIPEIQQLPLTMLFHEEMVKGNPEQRLGQRIIAMYEAADITPALQKAMIPVNLLGDPALRIWPSEEE